LHERDAHAIDLSERLARVAELGTPVRIGAPRRRLENEAELGSTRRLDVRRKVFRQYITACLTAQQLAGGEVGEVNAVQEDQRRLEPAVREEKARAELR